MTQFKKLLRTGLFAMIVLCGASACSNDDEPVAKNYELKEVAWTMQDNDEIKIIKQTAPDFFVDNNTDQDMEVEVSPTADVQQSSFFYTSDSDLFQL